jgi:predicted unusual protein kinase regulating ubiquinone biosynthesis (AarF/ABC1/UbiB family)
VFSNALGASVAELNFKSITDEFSALMYEYPFRVPAYYALIIRSLVTLEGIAINVDPDFKVLSKAYPYVAKRLLTDQSPELRASLQDLLFKDGSFRWNRLENLLRNARDSDEYDMDRLIDQTLGFCFQNGARFCAIALSIPVHFVTWNETPPSDDLLSLPQQWKTPLRGRHTSGKWASPFQPYVGY